MEELAFRCLSPWLFFADSVCVGCLVVQYSSPRRFSLNTLVFCTQKEHCLILIYVI